MAQKTIPTSTDVARLANVSQSAVSRVFTPGASVSETKRQRVLHAAALLGYRPNALARAMISGRSRIIAVLVTYLDNQFYPIVLEQLSRVLQDEGYQILLFMTEAGKQDEMVQKMLQYQVEGIVMASATLSSILANECAKTGIPVVLFNRKVTSSPTSSVTSDNFEGGRQLGRFLAAGQHTRIAFIAGDEDSSTSRDREAGFNKGLKELGQKVWARAVGGYSFGGAAQATRSLFGQPMVPDAVFVANDHMAFSVIDVLKNEYGLLIPDDVSVVGYDDVPQAAWRGYDLTTVKQPSEPMIEATVRILLDQIANGVVEKCDEVVSGNLIVRTSARLPKRADWLDIAAE